MGKKHGNSFPGQRRFYTRPGNLQRQVEQVRKDSWNSSQFIVTVCTLAAPPPPLGTPKVRGGLSFGMICPPMSQLVIVGKFQGPLIPP